MSTDPKIVTKFDPPPVPVRWWDWEATLDNYDPENNDPRGFGCTEAEAVANLIEQIEMLEDGYAEFRDETNGDVK